MLSRDFPEHRKEFHPVFFASNERSFPDFLVLVVVLSKFKLYIMHNYCCCRPAKYLKLRIFIKLVELHTNSDSTLRVKHQMTYYLGICKMTNIGR